MVLIIFAYQGFNSEEDVSFYAFDVQKFNENTWKKTDQANILILDALETTLMKKTGT